MEKIKNLIVFKKAIFTTALSGSILLSMVGCSNNKNTTNEVSSTTQEEFEFEDKFGINLRPNFLEETIISSIETEEETSINSIETEEETSISSIETEEETSISSIETEEETTTQVSNKVEQSTLENDNSKDEISLTVESFENLVENCVEEYKNAGFEIEKEYVEFLVYHFNMKYATDELNEKMNSMYTSVDQAFDLALASISSFNAHNYYSSPNKKAYMSSMVLSENDYETMHYIETSYDKISQTDSTKQRDEAINYLGHIADYVLYDGKIENHDFDHLSPTVAMATHFMIIDSLSALAGEFNLSAYENLIEEITAYYDEYVTVHFQDQANYILNNGTNCKIYTK